LLRRAAGTERFDDPSRTYDLEAAEALERAGDLHPEAREEYVRGLARASTMPPTAELAQ